MLVTIPATAHGRADAQSVLDLEPFLAFARQCRPDAVRLSPPVGADDQPNGAALLAMKGRLEAEGMRVVPGPWQVARGAPVTDPGWQIQNVFEASALIGAVGEASVDPLTIEWRAPCLEPVAAQPLFLFLERLLEHAERARVRLALRAELAPRQLSEILRRLDSPYLGACCRIGGAGEIRSLGEKLFALDAPAGLGLGPPGAAGAAGGVDWPALVQAVRSSGFSGPVFLPDAETPVAYACAVGFFHGLLAAGAGASPPGHGDRRGPVTIDN